MRNRTLLALALTGLLSLAACGEADLTVTTGGDSVTTEDTTSADEVANDVATTVAEIQAELTALSTEIQNSAAATELQESWNELQTEVLAAVATIRDDGTIDGSVVQAEIEQFQDALDALGDQVEPALNDAWDTLRNRLESVMS